MTISPDARTPSAELHTLSGSSRPGAAATVQSFMVATSPPANLGDTFVPLGGAAADVVAGLGRRRDAAAHEDAQVIDLGTRVAALARRLHAVWGRRAAIEDAVSLEIGSAPDRPEPSDPNLSFSTVERDGIEVGTMTRSLRPSEQQVQALAQHRAAMDDHERREAEVGARLGLPKLEKLCDRQHSRLIRWTERLTTLSPHGQAGLAAKAAALLALQETDTAGGWVTDLSKAVSRDAVRIATALAGEGDPDAELLALGRAWDVANKLLNEASLRESDAHDRFAATKPDIPEELFRTDTDHRHVGPYGSVHALTGRRWYGSRDTIEMFRQGCPSRLGKERRQEILDAYDRWQAGIAEAYTTCGLEAIADEVEALGNREFELRGRIISTPAFTSGGVQVKARVAFSLGVKWEEVFAQKIAEGVKNETIPAELVAVSIVLDLARMSCGAVAAVPPAADLASAA